MTTLKYGAKGADVRVMQTLLVRYGASIKIDGVFGPDTRAALRAFQKANELEVDGICGPKTWTALQNQTEPKSEHFKLKEFACKDGTAVPREYWGNVQALMNELEKIRKVWGKPITVISGYRTTKYNTQCGGAKASQHLKANAADIIVAGIAPSVVYAQLDKMYPNQGLGKYASFTHFDLRGKRSRW